MGATLNIKFGKPVFRIVYKTLRTIAIIAAILNLIIVIYSLELFNAAIDIKRRFGDYIDMMSDNGYIFPLFLSCSGLVALPINIFTAIALYLALSGVHKCMRLFLTGAVILCASLVIAQFVLIGITLSSAYTEDTNFHDGIISAITNYSTDGTLKTKIDRLQVEFQCCGSKSYKDWYKVQWYDTNFIRETDTVVKGETPFSCCSIRSILPCIHHGIEQGAGPYKYTPEANLSISIKGCHTVIEQKKKIVGWNITAYITGMILFQILGLIPLRFAQTAHIETGNFIKETHVYTIWFLGWLAKSDNKVISGLVVPKKEKDIPPPVPPLPPELMK